MTTAASSLQSPSLVLHYCLFGSLGRSRLRLLISCLENLFVCFCARHLTSIQNTRRDDSSREFAGTPTANAQIGKRSSMPMTIHCRALVLLATQRFLTSDRLHSYIDRFRCLLSASKRLLLVTKLEFRQPQSLERVIRCGSL